MTLVGLGGAKRAGKDAVASFLRDRLGFTVLGMSDALHEAMTTLDPVVTAPRDHRVQCRDGSGLWLNGIPHRYSELRQIADYDEMKTIPEVRRLLQVFGTEVGRGLFGEDVWVEAMRKKVREQWRGDAAAQNDTRIAVTGIRFENELDMIRELCGDTIYVKRPDLPTNTDTHASERSLISTDFDHVLVNDGSLSELEAKVIEHTFEYHGIRPTPSTTQS